MTTQKTFLIGIVAVVFTGLLVSPASAHRKYRPHHKGLPRRVLVRHSHEQAESVKSTSITPARTEEFDLLDAAFDVVAGAWKTIGKTVETVLGGEDKPAREAEN